MSATPPAASAADQSVAERAEMVMAGKLRCSNKTLAADVLALTAQLARTEAEKADRAARHAETGRDGPAEAAVDAFCEADIKPGANLSICVRRALAAFCEAEADRLVRAAHPESWQASAAADLRQRAAALRGGNAS